MKQLILVLAIGFLLCSEASAGVFVDGNELVVWMKESDKTNVGNADFNDFEVGLFLGYVSAITDSYQPLIAVPPNAKMGQMAAVVAKFLKAHPERWAEPAVTLIQDALREAFPAR